MDGSGNPRLADFGLATVSEDEELQWTTTTVTRDFDARWRAPEVIGIDADPQKPTFKSDIYSFGSVMFFVRFSFSLGSSILNYLPSDHLWGCTMERKEVFISNLHRTLEKNDSYASR